MYLCGYSLDNLSAMALTVATGFVVDDAIVVLENITRYIEQGLSPREAALKGAREIGFTVVSISSVAGGGVHSDPDDGWRGRAAVPRVRGGADRGDPGVDGGVAHHHADDGGDAAARRARRGARQGGSRRRWPTRATRPWCTATAAR